MRRHEGKHVILKTLCAVQNVAEENALFANYVDGMVSSDIYLDFWGTGER